MSTYVVKPFKPAEEPLSALTTQVTKNNKYVAPNVRHATGEPFPDLLGSSVVNKANKISFADLLKPKAPVIVTHDEVTPISTCVSCHTLHNVVVVDISKEEQQDAKDPLYRATRRWIMRPPTAMKPRRTLFEDFNDKEDETPDDKSEDVSQEEDLEELQSQSDDYISD